MVTSNRPRNAMRYATHKKQRRAILGNEVEVKPKKRGLRLNRAYVKPWYDERRYLVLKGGAGSGKSYFCADKILARCMTEFIPAGDKKGRAPFAHRFLLLRKVANTRFESFYTLLDNQIEKAGIGHEWVRNASKMSFYHIPTGARILTAGVDDVNKLKSIFDITGVWMEEATDFIEDDFLQIDTRMRSVTPFYQQIIMSFNPVSSSHWIKKLFDSPGGAFVDRTNTGFYSTTWRNNRFIDPAAGKRYENLAKVDENFARVFDRGEWGIENPEKLFAWQFNRDKHVSSRARYNPSLGAVWVYFDFNVAASAILFQKYEQGAYAIKEYHHVSGDLQSLVAEIRSDLITMKRVATVNTRGTTLADLRAVREDMIYVGGDASGGNRSGLATDRLSAFQQLAHFFGDGVKPLPWEQFNVPDANPAHGSSRLVSNLVLKNEPHLLINPQCAKLIHDLENVKFLNGSIDKSDDELTHLLDCWRYFIWAELSPRLARYGLQDIMHKFGLSKSNFRGVGNRGQN